MQIGQQQPGTPVVRPNGADTVGILVNVVWIVEHLDGIGLAELGDVPVLELAKHVSVVTWKAA